MKIIMMKMKTMTSIVCRASMEGNMNMMKMKKIMASKPPWDVHAVDLAACQTNRNVVWVAGIGMTRAMVWKGKVDHLAVRPDVV